MASLAPGFGASRGAGRSLVSPQERVTSEWARRPLRGGRWGVIFGGQSRTAWEASALAAPQAKEKLSLARLLFIVTTFCSALEAPCSSYVRVYEFIDCARVLFLLRNRMVISMDRIYYACLQRICIQLAPVVREQEVIVLVAGTDTFRRRMLSC